MKRYTVVIREIRFYERRSEIIWSLSRSKEVYQSLLYKHRDNSWHFDRDTAYRLNDDIRVKLLNAYYDKCADLAFERLSRIRDEEPNYSGKPSQLSRIDCQLRKEEMYRKKQIRLFREKQREELRKKIPDGIRAWRKEGELS